MSTAPRTRRARRRRISAGAIALRLGLYLIVTWGTLIVLARGLFAGAESLMLGLAIYSMLPLMVFALFRGWPFYPGAAFRLLVVRPFWYTQLLLPLVSGAGLLGILLGAPFRNALLVGRALAAVMLFAAAVLLVLGYLGTRRLVVRRVDADVPGLPAEFEGLRIVQLSDLHIGPHSNRRFLGRVVDAVRSLDPEIIAVTGDLIDDRAEDVAAYARALGSLAAPLGVYMIPGNHDVYAGWDEVERSLRSARLGTVLVNEVELLHRGDATLALVGTGDPAGGARGASRAAPDVDTALALVPEEATVIAFAHNPALWPSLAARGVALTLSGHTHWGQFALPKLGWSLASPFLEHAMGAHTERDSLLYISPGTGYWGIPFRLGASPEVTLVTLRRG
ncbi:MAG TPA: metallophosphoesterase, partial [Gemmatimonadaceae bacterium]|nr:metallophosphoesterase [Gemmatimonadaceae bacterium]